MNFERLLMWTVMIGFLVGMWKAYWVLRQIRTFLIAGVAAIEAVNRRDERANHAIEKVEETVGASQQIATEVAEKAAIAASAVASQAVEAAQRVESKVDELRHDVKEVVARKSGESHF